MYKPTHSNIFKAVDEIGDRLLEGDSVAPLKPELFVAMKSEFQSAVGATKRKVLHSSVVETPRNILLDALKQWKKECRTRTTNSSYRC